MTFGDHISVKTIAVADKARFDKAEVEKQRGLRFVGVTTATWDPPSIANGASASTTITVADAALGDSVVASFSLDLAGLGLFAYVSAANIVTVVLVNATGGAVDLASGTVSIAVIRMG